MSFLVERLVELRRHLDHLYALRPRVGSAADLERDLSLHNDVLFSLLTAPPPIGLQRSPAQNRAMRSSPSSSSAVETRCS
jgi:hypothetical protein